MQTPNLFLKKAAYLGIPLLLIILMGIFLIGMPESKGIQQEKERLEQAEARVLEAIASGNTDLAKALIVQLRWQYEASTVGGMDETNRLRQIWRNKRIEYLKVLGLDPEEFVTEEMEGETKGLKQQWREMIGK